MIDFAFTAANTVCGNQKGVAAGQLNCNGHGILTVRMIDATTCLAVDAEQHRLALCIFFRFSHYILPQ